jgi:rfaE bifunctional protein kinase chain/domain
MAFDTRDRKIKTVEELNKILGDPPRKEKVIMAHGTFDIVHPGHIRQLYYAKEKAPLLIASITADEFVGKRDGKPFVPQELRAKNLAALEMVDYVIIDHQEKPIDNILKIKPDLFVKGFEYQKDGIHPKTKEEIEAVSSYGGRVIFSPGDIVYSSTHLLTVHKPDISYDKLLSYMDADEITFDDILETLHQFKGKKVDVLGDTIVDKYSYCTVLGPTTKTPTFSVKLEESEKFVGGAGIVAKHVKSLGADVHFTTVLGDDDLKDFVLEDLKKWKIKTNSLIDPTRPTTLKDRFWADGYKMLQVDTVDNSIISDRILTEICNHLKTAKPDVLMFSDFRHGIFNREIIQVIMKTIGSKPVTVADSQVSNRWGNILDFKGVDIIFPNEKEARFALGDQDTGIRPLASKLYEKSNAKHLVLKMGEKGSLVYRQPGENPRDFYILDSFAENTVDAIGAGDAMMAVTALAFKCSNNILISSFLGNIAAALVCEKEGNIPVTVKEIEDKIHKIQENI